MGRRDFGGQRERILFERRERICRHSGGRNSRRQDCQILRGTFEGKKATRDEEGL